MPFQPRFWVGSMYSCHISPWIQSVWLCFCMQYGCVCFSGCWLFRKGGISPSESLTWTWSRLVWVWEDVYSALPSPSAVHSRFPHPPTCGAEEACTGLLSSWLLVLGLQISCNYFGLRLPRCGVSGRAEAEANKAKTPCESLEWKVSQPLTSTPVSCWAEYSLCGRGLCQSCYSLFYSVLYSFNSRRPITACLINPYSTLVKAWLPPAGEEPQHALVLLP